jgi:hypothetical protein
MAKMTSELLWYSTALREETIGKKLKRPWEDMNCCPMTIKMGKR